MLNIWWGLTNVLQNYTKGVRILTMRIDININTQLVPFGSYHLQIRGKLEELEESEEEKKLRWPYQFPSHTGSLRPPVTIWSSTPA